MASSSQGELFKVLRESQSKYTYFLLAAVGAGIGFALTQTQNDPLSLTHIPLGLAIISWGASFYCGCKHLSYVHSNLFANFDLLKMQAGTHPEVGRDPNKMHIAKEVMIEIIEDNSETSSKYANWQFRLLIFGAVTYIVWHVIEMAIR